MRETTVIAVDLAKNVFQIAVSDRPGQVGSQTRIRRNRVLEWFSNRPAATVVLEACGSAHHWARELSKLGHQPVLLPAHYVRPYVRGNKTDSTDTLGLLEAYRHAIVRPVPVKTLDQQALAGLHRLRSGWIDTRTARLNSLRGLLREFGEVIPLGAKRVVPQLRALLIQDPSPVPPLLHGTLQQAAAEVEELERRVAEVDQVFRAQTRESEELQRLQTIPGIGLVTATALVACLGTPHRFPSARHLSSFLGLTPREHSSGERRRLGGITRRGDRYLRTLLIHGARAVLTNARKRQAEPDRLRSWGLRVVAHRGKNKGTVAVANKLARLAWAVWARGHDYVPQPATAQV